MKKAVGLDIRKDGWTAVELKLTGKRPEITAVTGGEWDPAADPVSRGKLLDRAWRVWNHKRRVIPSLPTLYTGRHSRPTLFLQAAVRTDLETEVSGRKRNGFFLPEWKTGGPKVEAKPLPTPTSRQRPVADGKRLH